MRIVRTVVLALLVAVAGDCRLPSETPHEAAAGDAGRAQPAYHLPPGKLAKAISLNRIRDIEHFVDGFWGMAVPWLILATGAAAAFERAIRRLVGRRWVQGLLYFAALILVLSLAELPLDMYMHTVSRDYGISVQGWGGWFLDLAKSLGLGLALGAPLMLFFHWIVRRWPRRYWLGIWVVMLPLMVVVVFASPLVEPLFNQYEPLEKNYPGLVVRLEEVAERTGTRIPPGRMFLMKASSKTNGLNAYVSGLGRTKRIVVWDTTAGRLPDDIVMFVFGHESGHYVLHHIPKMMAGFALALFFVFWGCAHSADWLARRFGRRWGLDEAAPLAGRAGFVVLLFTVSVASFVLEPAANGFSRHFEHEADIYGQEALHGLVPDPQRTAVEGFNALGEAWLEDPDPSPFIEFWEYSHPSVRTRAEFAAHYDPWAQGGHGQFFAR